MLLVHSFLSIIYRPSILIFSQDGPRLEDFLMNIVTWDLVHSRPSCYPLPLKSRNEDPADVDAECSMFAEGLASVSGFVFDASDIELERAQELELAQLAAFESGSKLAPPRLPSLQSPRCQEH